MPDILCENCESMVPAGRFCLNCAAPLDRQPESVAPPQPRPQQQAWPPPQTGQPASMGGSLNPLKHHWNSLPIKSKAWMIGIVVGIISLAIYNGSDTTRQSPQSTPPSIPPSTSQPAAPVATSPPPEPRTPPAPVKPEALRAQLQASYKDAVVSQNPHLNFIKSKLTKIKGGYGLWAVHEFFNQYSFSAGDDAKAVAAWIVANHQDLVNANIVQVGFMGENSFSGSCWLNIKK